MAEQTTVTAVRQTGQVAGAYLTFSVAGQEYGVEIVTVREIMGMTPIAPATDGPEYVRGVVNLRGKAIPIVDLRVKLGLGVSAHTDPTGIIVVDAGGVEIGIVVDKVTEVIELAADDIEPPPSFGLDVDAELILGVVQADGAVTALLDIRKALAGEGAR